MTLTSQTGQLIDTFKPIDADYTLLNQKLNVLLVVGGLKDATEWQLFSPAVKTANDAQPVAMERQDELEEFLDSLGVVFNHTALKLMVETYGGGSYRTRIVYRIAKDMDTLKLMEKIWTDDGKYPSETELYAKLSGIPQTAQLGYSAKNIIPREKLPKAVQSSDAFAFAQFILTKDDYKDELKVSKKWAETAKEYAPGIYSEITQNSARTVATQAAAKKK